MMDSYRGISSCPLPFSAFTLPTRRTHTTHSFLSCYNHTPPLLTPAPPSTPHLTMSSIIRSQLFAYGILSTGITIALVSHVYNQRLNFYATAVQLAGNSGSLIVSRTVRGVSLRVLSFSFSFSPSLLLSLSPSLFLFLSFSPSLPLSFSLSPSLSLSSSSSFEKRTR